MDQELQVTDIKTEPTESTSCNRLEISSEIQINTLIKESKCLIHSKFDIKTELQEDENEFPIIADTYNDLGPNRDIKMETEKPLIKIEYEDIVDELMQDPLDVSSEIKDEKPFSINLEKESWIKTELTEEGIKDERTKDEVILETNKTDSHGSGPNQDQDQLLIKNYSDRRDKKYVCNECHKGFRQKNHLEDHLRIHTGEKPFKCVVCKKSFNRKSSLDIHTRIHSGEKPYACDVCKKVFGDKSVLTKHKLIHSEVKLFSCKDCNKSFTHMSNLIRHKHIHTGAKPFACDLCVKTFTQTSHLNTHRRLHTGEKPFSCDVCNKSFANKSYLNQHKKIHRN